MIRHLDRSGAAVAHSAPAPSGKANCKLERVAAGSLCLAAFLLAGVQRADAAVRSVTFPVLQEPWTPTSASATVSVDPGTGSATITAHATLDPSTDTFVPAVIPRTTFRFEDGRSRVRLKARVEADSVLWSVKGGSRVAKTLWSGLPAGGGPLGIRDLTTTFTSPALVGSPAVAFSRVRSKDGVWLGFEQLSLSPLSGDEAEALAWARAKRVTRGRATRESVACSFVSNNSAACQTRYRIGRKRFGMRVDVSPAVKAVARGENRWIAFALKPKRLRPARTTLR